MIFVPPEKNKNHTRELFDSFYKWSKEAIDKEFKTAVWEHINLSEIAAICNRLNRLNDNNYVVVDAGCGSGRLLYNLKNRYAKIIGCDFSIGLLKKAKDSYHGKLDLMQVEITNLPLKNESADIVLSVRVIQHMSAEQQQKAINEMARVLKKGGRLILMTYNALTFLAMYKLVNMSGLYKIWPRWPLRDWKWLVDNYSFPWEIRRMFKKASLYNLNISGAVCGEPEMFKFLKISNFLEKKLGFIFNPYLRLCRKIDFRVNKKWPFKFLLGRVLVEGEKIG